MVKREINEERLNAFFDTLLVEVQTDPSVNSFARDRLVHRARKKARFVNPDLQQKAISDFLCDNNRIGDFEICLDQDIVDNAKHYITVMLERFTTRIDPPLIQETLSFSFLFDNWRYGPGASFETLGTHAADKIKQKMTCTTSCEPFVSQLRRLNPYFKGFDALNQVPGLSVVNGSKLTTVPKNQDTERTIAVEPLGNMCLQLAAGTYLEGVLRYLGLDIKTQQPKNRELARIGSITEGFATLDLKSASNMISTELVRLLFPKKWYELLMALRSPEIQLPNKEWVELKMMSTMGNGFTFPLMTLIITSLIYSYRCRKPSNPTLYVDWRKTAVFGDDIIIPIDEYDLCCETLERAGFVINHDKSYREGQFRESCGGDYFAGVDVSPFYCKSLSTDSEVYVVINQVLEWQVKHNCFLPSTINLLSTFLQGKLHLVPEWHNADEGVLTQVCNRRYSYLTTKSDRRTILETDWFAMPLAVAGYINTAELNRSHTAERLDSLCYTSTPSDPDMFYLPRSNNKRSKVRKARLPNGYLDGWDSRKRSQNTSAMISLYVQLTIGYTGS